MEVITKQIKDESTDYIADSNIVLGFIMEKYIVTNDEKDRISSSVLFTDFNNSNRGNKMTSSKFKDDMCNISGISCKRLKIGVVFCGLRCKVEEDNKLEDDE